MNTETYITSAFLKAKTKICRDFRVPRRATARIFVPLARNDAHFKAAGAQRRPCGMHFKATDFMATEATEKKEIFYMGRIPI